MWRILQLLLPKLCCYCFSPKIMRFQNGSNKVTWQLNSELCNFGLKSYLWFQMELALRARSILKSRVWFQTKLHSTQFNYHYIYITALYLKMLNNWKSSKESRHFSVSRIDDNLSVSLRGTDVLNWQYYKKNLVCWKGAFWEVSNINLKMHHPRSSRR